MSSYVLVLLIVNVLYLTSINAKDLQIDVTTSAAPTSTLQRSRTEDFHKEAENLSKRDLKEKDFSSGNTNGFVGKSYEPPSEFYRGSASTGQSASTQASLYHHNNHKPYEGFKSRPIAFPDTYNSGNKNNNYNNAQDGVQLASNYNSWQHLKTKVGALLDKKDTLQDRISVGHYGTAQHGSATSGDYAYEGRPYSSHAHHVDYYGSGGSVAPSAHAAGYYGGTAAAEGIPFDVYGSKNHYPSSAGNDYPAYSYSDGHESGLHKSQSDISQKALLAKSFLIPLVSAAVLGIAAALASNPLLLQLGTVSGVAPVATAYGKRKRRELPTAVTPKGNSTNGLDLALSSFDKSNDDSKLLPYRDHQQQPAKQKRGHRHRHFVRT